MIVRDMMPADLSIAHSINQANVPAVGEETFADFEHIFGVSSMNLVVEAEGSVRGFCMVMPPGVDYQSPNYLYFCDNYTSFVYLDRVAVADGWRGRGIGPLLYREVERRARADWFTLEVNVKPLNEGSLRFHSREGFVEVSQQETRPGKIVSLMAKRLR